MKRIRLTEAQLYGLIRQALNEYDERDDWDEEDDGNEEPKIASEYLEHGDKAFKVNSEEDLETFFSQHNYSESLQSEVLGKIKMGDWIIPVGYYDAQIGDWIVVTYFEKECPNNIATIGELGGSVVGVIFGRGNFLDDAINDAINRSDTFNDLKEQAVDEAVDDIVSHYGLQLDNNLENLLRDYLWRNMGEITPAYGMCYDEDNLKEFLSQNGYLGQGNANESLARRVTESVLRKLRRA